MQNQAKGTFQVKLEPQEDDSAIARMLIDKVFQGGLEATSEGQMLSFNSEIKGSAGYVALEKVTGKLNGKAGTFVLQHNGSMNRGDAQLSLNVVPDSGTQELSGLTGSMTIEMSEGKHSYQFDFELAD